VHSRIHEQCSKVLKNIKDATPVASSLFAFADCSVSEVINVELDRDIWT